MSCIFSCKKIQIRAFGHYERDSNAIPFQYKKNSALHLSTNIHNNKILHSQITLLILNQVVLTLPFLWLKNGKSLNYKKLVLSNQFQIKHMETFFLIVQWDFFVCFLFVLGVFLVGFNSLFISDVCAVTLCTGLGKLHHRLRKKYVFTFTWTLWPGFVVAFAFLTNKEFLVQQPAHDISLINSHDSHETLL